MKSSKTLIHIDCNWFLKVIYLKQSQKFFMLWFVLILTDSLICTDWDWFFKEIQLKQSQKFFMPRFVLILTDSS